MLDPTDTAPQRWSSFSDSLLDSKISQIGGYDSFEENAYLPLFCLAFRINLSKLEQLYFE
ncbi:hypothetical protein [Legionella sp.]|uniref:hypothetical protein n=1 Tax=Legionella sp. TaxID=459 RepID=UPI000A9DA787|nr:hypothetical protein [Legionella sp.]